MDTTTPISEHLYDLLNDFDVSMLVTTAEDGTSHARPMAIAELQADADAYLVTRIDSAKITEVERNPQATLTFQSLNKFAVVRGRLSVVQERALIDRLWKESWKLWFPQGKNDPSIALLRFEAEDGEYWNNAGVQGLKYIFAAANAFVKGETPAADDQMHAKVQL